MNPRHPAPKAGALPDCATPRLYDDCATGHTIVFLGLQVSIKCNVFNMSAFLSKKRHPLAQKPFFLTNSPILRYSITFVSVRFVRTNQSSNTLKLEGDRTIKQRIARVAKLVDALDLGSSAARCGSSSLPSRTNIDSASPMPPFPIGGICNLQ